MTSLSSHRVNITTILRVAGLSLLAFTVALVGFLFASLFIYFGIGPFLDIVIGFVCFSSYWRRRPADSMPKDRDIKRTALVVAAVALWVSALPFVVFLLYSYSTSSG